jgi:glycosyltransferase involved in cell wall biosynthesis
MTTETKSIKALMVDSEETWRGGEGQVFLLMKGLTDRGVDVELASPPGSAIEARAKDVGIACVPVAIAGGLDIKAAWTLRGHIETRRYDIVHCHSSHAHGAARLAVEMLGFGGSRRPRMVVSRRVDFRVGRFGLGALKYRHGVDRFLAISTGVRDVLVSCGVDADRIELVPSGIDLDKFSRVGDNNYLDAEFGFDKNTVVIGNVAALAPHKSQSDFIIAAEKVREKIPAARFLIVGEGELRPDLERMIAERELKDAVTLTGFRKDVLEVLSRFDCFVLSSYLEGLCTSIMDAHAMGIPVVATRTGGVPDLVIDGETGLLVPPRDPGALADAIERMVGDEELRARCSAQARKKSATYGYENMVDKTLDVYQRLVSPAGKSV